ncbi:MAG: prepilin peptidase [Pirellulales bacterium]|nr:prepilin peptidase [Pirellulales bacterium]
MFLTESIRWILFVWLTVLGGCIGSFLNVVIYRLPRRISLISPGSQCPSCHHPIRWWHNIPIISWLILRGRCYDCGGHIPIRYPMVETVVAFWFGVLAWYGPLGSSSSFHLDTKWLIYRDTISSIWSIYLTHLVLCCTLLCLTLIDSDSVRQSEIRYPMILWGSALVFGLLIPMRPIAILQAEPVREWLGELFFERSALHEIGRHVYLMGIGIALLGILIFLAILAIWNFPKNRNAWRGLLHMILIGLFLGVEVVFITGVIGVLVGIFARCIPMPAKQNTPKKIPASGQDSWMLKWKLSTNSEDAYRSARWASVAMLLVVTACMLAGWIYL